MQFKTFDGTEGLKHAEVWLGHLQIFENEWEHEKLLKQAGILMMGRAKTWFKALIDEEIQTWDDFVKYFRKKFLKKNQLKMIFCQCVGCLVKDLKH